MTVPILDISEEIQVGFARSGLCLGARNEAVQELLRYCSPMAADHLLLKTRMAQHAAWSSDYQWSPSNETRAPHGLNERPQSLPALLSRL